MLLWTYCRAVLLKLSDVVYQQDIFPMCHLLVPYLCMTLKNIVCISVVMLIHTGKYNKS